MSDLEKSKILLVDDRPENLVALKTTLSALKDVEFITANSGQEALLAALNHDFALIILDVQMPKMDGYELAGYLRAEERTRLVPIIFMSAVHSEEYHAFHGKNSGAVDFLTKPYNPKTLLNKTELLVSLQKQKNRLEAQHRELREQHAKLKQTQAQLVEAAKLASMGSLTSGIAHELNQPLGIIMLSASVAKECLRDEEFDELRESLERIESNVKRSAEVTSHLRSFGRELADERTRSEHLEVLTQNSLFLVREQLRQNNVELVTDFAPDLPPVTGKLKQLEQVIGALLNNARDALLKAPEKRLCIRGSREHHSLTLVVEDSGCGIPEETLPHIFDPFFTTKPVGKGQGLGLSASFGIIKEHGGGMTVESEVGRGTRFRITLPI